MTRWERADDGTSPERVELRQDAEWDMAEGQVAVFGPGAVHRVRNTRPEPTLALICYGRDFAKIWRNVYDLGARTVKRICFGPPPMPPRDRGAGGATEQAAPALWPAQHAVYRPEKMGKSTIFETSHVIVGLNAFEPGQEHALHIHGDRDKVYYVLEGHGQLLRDGAAIEVEPGMLMPAPIGTPHGIRNTGHTRLLLLTVLAPGAHS